MKKALSVVALLLAVCMLFSACGTDSTTTTKQETTQTDTQASVVETEAETESQPATGEFRIGETWTVDGQWTLTVDSITETSDRNEFADTDPAAVYVVAFTYSNIGYVDDSGIMDGLYLVMDDSIVDSTGLMGYSYPGDITNYPQETPVGATCKGEVCIGVDNAGLPIKINVLQYDGNGQKQTATFILE